MLRSGFPRGSPHFTLGELLRSADARACTAYVVVSDPPEGHDLGDGLLLTALTESGAVALVPAGTPPPTGVVALELEDRPTVPLVLLWPAGRPSPAVEVLRRALAPTPGRDMPDR
ncbi:MAG: hypothetical protein M0P31_13480 [Solirubrobacteraceae bacterium]|nr:hypothetical protein [Solirubrobacteraceae bacterium]